MLIISSAFEDLARVYPWLDAEASRSGLPISMLYGMHVALEETVMNVATHSFPPDHPGEIRVSLRSSGEEATLLVEDNGCAFDPTGVAPIDQPATLEPGGLGLVLLRHYCDDISYERASDWNRLTLRFTTVAADADRR